ncbi:MAG: transglutaminase domain-containing protein [Clostridia bacterium]|nr:transglutaminase domain-containing protein [Clostridia bacterium]
MKKVLCAVLAFVFVLCMSGCSSVEFLLEATVGKDAVSAAEDTVYFGFSNGTLFEDSEEVFLTAQELEAYQSTTADYHAAVLFEQLTAEEQAVYRALTYALENQYTNILFEKQLVRSDDPLIKALNCVALDSPMLEQNLRYATGTFTTYLPIPLWGPFHKQLALEGYYLEVDNFAAEHWEKKQEALAEAKRLVEPYLENNDKGFVAEELYRFVANNVTYSLDNYTDTDTVYPYVYDALLGRITNCDGYANALSLLYNLAGIPCVEKMNDEEGSSPGHTWNLFQIGDNWYNADATTNSAIPTADCSLHAGMFFGFEDRVEDNVPKYGLMYPVSLSGLYMTVDAYLDSPHDAFDEVMDAFEQHDWDWALVAFKNHDKDALGDLLQDVANALGHNITSRAHESKSDTVVCICDSAFYD